MRCQAPCGEVNSGLHICIKQAGLLQQVMQIKPGPEHAGSLQQIWEKMEVVPADILCQYFLDLTKDGGRRIVIGKKGFALGGW